MDIMTTLFDQDYITELLGLEREQKGLEQGLEQGRFQSFFNVMQNLKFSAEQALDAIGMDVSERDKYITMLANLKSKDSN